MENTWLQLRKVVTKKHKLNNVSFIMSPMQLRDLSTYTEVLSREGGH